MTGVGLGYIDRLVAPTLSDNRSELILEETYELEKIATQKWSQSIPWSPSHRRHDGSIRLHSLFIDLSRYGRFQQEDTDTSWDGFDGRSMDSRVDSTKTARDDIETHGFDGTEVEASEQHATLRRILVRKVASIGARARGKIFFTTTTGLVGIGPAAAKVGDIVMYPFGFYSPFILRPDGDQYRMVGAARVAGLESAAAMESYCTALQLPERTFDIK
jgi:hypothetical protein